MQLRRTILRYLLWSLGIAAVAGVLSVLLPTRDVMFRVMLTGLTTAIGAGLLIAMTFLLDRRVSRWAGLYGVSVVFVEFVLCLMLIWLEPIMRGQLEEQTAVTAGLVGLVSFPMLGILTLARASNTLIAGRLGALVAAASLIFFMLATWLPGWMWSRDEYWVTGWILLGNAVVIVVCLVGARFDVRYWWRWAGVGCAAIGFAISMVAMWTELRVDPDGLEKSITLFTSLSMIVAFGNLASAVPLRSGQRWLRWATVGSAVLVALFVNILVFTEGRVAEDLLERLAAASGILLGCGSLALVVVAALNRRVAIEPGYDAIPTEMTVICPMCRQKQSITTGRGACRKCGLRMDIKLAEPRCPECSYLMYGLHTDRCPECGHAFGVEVGMPATDAPN